jgi:hypothetical protein
MYRSLGKSVHPSPLFLFFPGALIFFPGNSSLLLPPAAQSQSLSSLSLYFLPSLRRRSFASFLPPSVHLGWRPGALLPRAGGVRWRHAGRHCSFRRGQARLRQPACEARSAGPGGAAAAASAGERPTRAAGERPTRGRHWRYGQLVGAVHGRAVAAARAASGGAALGGPRRGARARVARERAAAGAGGGWRRASRPGVGASGGRPAARGRTAQEHGGSSVGAEPAAGRAGGAERAPGECGLAARNVLAQVTVAVRCKRAQERSTGSRGALAQTAGGLCKRGSWAPTMQGSSSGARA